MGRDEWRPKTETTPHSRQSPPFPPLVKRQTFDEVHKTYTSRWMTEERQTSGVPFLRKLYVGTQVKISESRPVGGGGVVSSRRNSKVAISRRPEKRRDRESTRPRLESSLQSLLR